MKAYTHPISTLSLCSTLLLGSSCATHRPLGLGGPVGRPLNEVYTMARQEGAQADEEHMRRELAIQSTLGYVRPYVPVRTPPNVMPVWIPTFVNEEGDMVSAHWVYMVRQKEQWFIEEEASPGMATLTVPHAAHKRDTRPARARGGEAQGSTRPAAAVLPSSTTPVSPFPFAGTVPADTPWLRRPTAGLPLTSTVTSPPSLKTSGAQP